MFRKARGNPDAAQATSVPIELALNAGGEAAKLEGAFDRHPEMVAALAALSLEEPAMAGLVVNCGDRDHSQLRGVRRL